MEYALAIAEKATEEAVRQVALQPGPVWPTRIEELV
jgi:hypothetical protein